MISMRIVGASVVFVTMMHVAFAQDVQKQALRVVQDSTLDQSGTHPFHLRAELAPMKESDRPFRGTVDYWWESPQRYRREIRTTSVSQTLVVNGPNSWETENVDFVPVGLEALAIALVRPVPLSPDLLAQRLRTAEVKEMHLPMKNGGTYNQVNFTWKEMPQAKDALSEGEGYLATLNGSLFYTGGLGWGGEYHDVSSFHGRKIARTIDSAKIVVLEDLSDTDRAKIDEKEPATAHRPHATVPVTTSDLRTAMMPGTEAFHWPTVDQGPLDGVVWAEFVLDRDGKVRSIGKPVADNGAMVAAATEGFEALRFRPIMKDGEPTQAIGKVYVSFHTSRPAGVESLPSARDLFRAGRARTTYAGAAKQPYKIDATMQFGGPKGLTSATYRDEWLSEREWRREAKTGNSQVIRAQVKDTWYRREDGSDAAILRMMLTVIEPIPADDTMTESDWRVTRELVAGYPTIRVIRGPEFADAATPSGQAQAYWFATDGRLLQAYTSGFVIRYGDFRPTDSVPLPRLIELNKDGKLAARITLNDPSNLTISSKELIEKGHEWKRAFTAETR